jgi:hypothetical protein
MTNCKIDGCSKTVVAIGYCDTHYRRAKRGDDLTAPMKGSRPQDHTGKRFGMWVAVSRSANKGTRTAWLCRCDCGKEESVLTCHLVSGKSFSCGCNKYLLQAKRLTTHGMSNSDEYRIWSLMIGRCTNSSNTSYKDYGGRGISVCDRWKDFTNFYSDIGPRPTKGHSIGRVDNDKGYSPDNCRWETHEQQANNTRRNSYHVIDGERKTLAEICRERGLNYGTVKWRIYNGESILEAIR